MDDKPATLHLGDETIEFPAVSANVGNNGIDISKLRGEQGIVTYDPGFANTASTRSSLTYVNGARGELMHCGYKIEDLAANCSFLEVAYLLLFGELPSQKELGDWETSIREHTLLNEELKRFFDAFPKKAHPMAILSSATNAISTFYEDYHDPSSGEATIESTIRLMAKMPTIASWAYRKSAGHPYVYPRNELGYVDNFLHMMFALPVEEYEIDPIISKALNVLLILHADHGQNASTATVRFVGSTQANLFASVSAGINALWGPLHGGANQKVLEMLGSIHADPEATAETYIARAKDKNDPFRLMGFGHRVYKNYDPRARILKTFADEVLARAAGDDPLLQIADKLEKAALSDDYFVSRNLYPNVDFYSGILFRALGFPTRMFTVLFAIGRLPGWIANWKEMMEDPDTRISRPRQIYVGEPERAFVPLHQR